MSIHKLFSHGHETALSGANEFAIEAPIFRYAFSTLWEMGPQIILFQLQGSINNDSAKHNIITQVVTDNDGEISVSIGTFAQGTQLNLFWAIRALEAIERCSVFITNIDTRQAKKIKPNSPNDFKAIKAGDNWVDEQSGIILF